MVYIDRIEFDVPVVPVGQMRARACVRGNHAAVYKAKEQESRERVLCAILAGYRPGTPWDRPLKLGVKAYLPMPKSLSKSKRAAALAGQIRPTAKPDLDNLLKHLKDCMTQLGFWTDDKLIVEYLPGTGKYYSDRPRWEIVVQTVG